MMVQDSDRYTKEQLDKIVGLYEWFLWLRSEQSSDMDYVISDIKESHTWATGIVASICRHNPDKTLYEILDIVYRGLPEE